MNPVTNDLLTALELHANEAKADAWRVVPQFEGHYAIESEETPEPKGRWVQCVASNLTYADASYIDLAAKSVPDLVYTVKLLREALRHYAPKCQFLITGDGEPRRCERLATQGRVGHKTMCEEHGPNFLCETDGIQFVEAIRLIEEP